MQCHPALAYARDTFGLDYTQDETYYVMEPRPGAWVFLGLQEGADLDAVQGRSGAQRSPGTRSTPSGSSGRHQAEQHRLYLIPAGTVHASGAGNVVLEISATPYLYTLRFYDWLRRDLDGHLRPVHVRPRLREPRPAAKRRRGRGADARSHASCARERLGELELGRHPELFFAVHRLDFADEAEDDARGALPRAQPRRRGRGRARDGGR